MRAREVLQYVERKTGEHRSWRAEREQMLEDAKADRLIADFEAQRQEQREWEDSAARWERQQCARRNANLIVKRREYITKPNTIEPAVKWSARRHNRAASTPEYIETPTEALADEVAKVCGKLDARITRLERLLLKR